MFLISWSILNFQTEPVSKCHAQRLFAHDQRGHDHAAEAERLLVLDGLCAFLLRLLLGKLDRNFVCTGLAAIDDVPKQEMKRLAFAFIIRVCD